MSHTSSIIAFFMNEGVPPETIKLILLLPIIATFIAFLRQVIGIKAFGIYTPLIVTFAFIATNGLKYGIAIFIIVILIGMIMRFALRPFRMLYLPRVAIMLTVVAFCILIILALGGNLKRTGLASVSIFPIVIMITMVEKFVAVQIEKGDKMAVRLALETLLISIIGFFIATFKPLTDFIIAYPWTVLFTLPINVLLGKWTGLRLAEYIRFRDVIKKM